MWLLIRQRVIFMTKINFKEISFFFINLVFIIRIKKNFIQDEPANSIVHTQKKKHNIKEKKAFNKFLILYFLLSWTMSSEGCSLRYQITYEYKVIFFFPFMLI